MGDIVGGIIGGIGSLAGGSSAKKNDLTGYNYLTGQNGVGSTVQNGTAANDAAGQLLGTAPVTSQTQNGFSNYLNSTGYNFQMDQGQRAITGSAAAKGILNSGSTAKALTQYGQGLAGQTFNNYLGQLNTQSAQGLTASGQIGSAGTTGGVAAGSNQQSGISSAGGQLGSAAGSLFSNFFGGI